MDDNESIIPISEWPVTSITSSLAFIDTHRVENPITDHWDTQNLYHKPKGTLDNPNTDHWDTRNLCHKPKGTLDNPNTDHWDTQNLCHKPKGTLNNPKTDHWDTQNQRPKVTHSKIYSQHINSLTCLETEFESTKKLKLDSSAILDTAGEHSYDANTLQKSHISDMPLKKSNEQLKEVEPLAEIRVARWWRRNRHLHKQNLPTTSNPNTILYFISRTKECISFLLEEKRKLNSLSQLHHKERADIYAAIASIDDMLGIYQSALDNISHAVDLDSFNRKYKWLKAKLQKQCIVIENQKAKLELVKNVPKTFPIALEVKRISANELSVDEFINCFVAKKQAVILLDVVKDLTKSTWDMDFVASKAGAVKATVKCSVPFSVEWAKLEQSREITVGEFIDQVKEGQTSDYLFDWSLPIHCPMLAMDLKVPKYFSDNFLQKTLPGSLYHDSWPSLFIAPKGTVSNLHIDAFASNFWMALFQGEKRWTFFDTDDVPLLCPQYIHSMDPVFNVDLSHPNVEQCPLLALTKPKQCVLKPGNNSGAFFHL